MKEMREKTIDGIEYKMYEMNPFTASDILGRLLKLLGKPIASVVRGVKKKEGQSILDSDFNMDMIGSAVEELSSRMSEKAVKILMKDLLPVALITFREEGSDEFKKIDKVETHFGKYKLIHLYKVLKFSLEVNFENFFENLAELKD